MRKICLKDTRAAPGRAGFSSLLPNLYPCTPRLSPSCWDVSSQSLVCMLATGKDVSGCDPLGKQYQRAFGQMLSPGPSKQPTMCQTRTDPAWPLPPEARGGRDKKTPVKDGWRVWRESEDKVTCRGV